jgi:hypothetical protein
MVRGVTVSALPFAKDGSLVAADEVQVVAPALSGLTVVRFAPTVDIAPVGSSLVLRVQDVTGASPTGYIQATITAGTKVGVATGSFAVASGATIFVRVVSGPTGGNAASYLGGYFETLVGSAAATTTFCTLAQIKSFAGITVTTYDAELTLIIENTTGAMQRYMQRDITQTVYSVERHSFAQAASRLVLNHRPIISVQEVRVDGSVVATADYVAQLPEGVLYSAGGWPSGSYHVEADYTAGYATIPAALVSACLLQSRYIWTQYQKGGDRFGEAQRAEASGGSTAFVVEDWYPGVRASMNGYRRIF